MGASTKLHREQQGFVQHMEEASAAATMAVASQHREHRGFVQHMEEAGAAATMAATREQREQQGFVNSAWFEVALAHGCLISSAECERPRLVWRPL